VAVWKYQEYHRLRESDESRWNSATFAVEWPIGAAQYSLVGLKYLVLWKYQEYHRLHLLDEPPLNPPLAGEWLITAGVHQFLLEVRLESVLLLLVDWKYQECHRPPMMFLGALVSSW
jgi:hypothetical protein